MEVAVRSPSLTDQVIATLRQAIIAQEFEPGESLVEATTAARLGVSRGPLREAIRRLEVEGLVEAGRRGYVVVGISNDDIDEIYSVRAVLEPFAVTLAVDRRTPKDEEELQLLQTEIDEATKSKEPFRFRGCGRSLSLVLLQHGASPASLQHVGADRTVRRDPLGNDELR